MIVFISGNVDLIGIQECRGIDLFYTDYKGKYSCIYINSIEHKQRRGEVVTLSSAANK